MDIASRLKNLRTKRGISLYKLAKISGVAQSFLSDVETGKKTPTVITLQKICDALGISLAEFFAAKPGEVPEHINVLLREAKDLTPAQTKKLAEFIKSMKEKETE